MLVKSITFTPEIYDDRKAEVIIDPNPKASKFCYLHLILNNENEFEILGKPPEHACTQDEIDAAVGYGKQIITSGMAAFSMSKDDLERQSLNMNPSDYTDYRNYQEALVQFAKYVKMHAVQDGDYKVALSDYIKGYFRAGECKGKTQKAMKEDVINMVKTIYGSHPDVYVELLAK